MVVATPHHWHCPIAIRALAAGKDIYVEKPASHVFREGRLLVEAASKHKRIVQHGTQMRSSDVTAEAGKVLASGILGEIKTTKAWNCQRQNPPKAVADGDVPAGVNYDLWLGPAPERRFNRLRFHRTWQLFRDYGNGATSATTASTTSIWPALDSARRRTPSRSPPMGAMPIWKRACANFPTTCR
jgi:hypothetical protein